MRAKFVNESYDVYYENQLFECLINEEFNYERIKNIISNIKDKKTTLLNLIKKFNKSHNLNVKKYIAGILVILYLSSFAYKNNKWNTATGHDINKAAIELSKNDTLNLSYIEEFFDIPKIFSPSKELIDEINKIKPNFLSIKKLEQYNQYDKNILNVTDLLKNKGEKPNPELIKAIMLMETGMKPTKNEKGFFGFPQTKSYIINSVNKRNKTNFTVADMYNPEKSAEFIYYYLKTTSKSMYVNNTRDLIIAYNWGIGNLGKYKRGEESLPKETNDYVDMFNIIKKYFLN